MNWEENMKDEQIKKAFKFVFTQLAEIEHKISEIKEEKIGFCFDLYDLQHHFDRKYKEIFEEEDLE